MPADAALRYFEDIVPGETARSAPFDVTHAAVIAFAQMYDPQPFHLDEAVAKASLLGGLAASGWHTSAIGMRLYYETFVRHVASMGAPGVDEARWLQPVRPGDRLILNVTIVDKRPSASRPDRGFITVALDLRNGNDACVMTQHFVMIVQRRGTTQAAGATQTDTSTRPPAHADIIIPASPPSDPMLTAFYDAVPIGHEAALGTEFFTAEAITTFAAAFDPQYFHLDAQRAAQSHFGGLVASGWQTAAFWMKHYIAARTRSSEARAAAGLPAAVGGPSPGFTAMKWLRPVHAGETLAYGLKITGKRPMTRAGWGIIFTENTGHTPDGSLAFSFEGRMLWPLGPDATA